MGETVIGALNLLVREQTIAFQCEACGREIVVSALVAGRRGRCPKCNAAISVPDSSAGRRVLGEGGLRCKNPHLQRLYESVRELAGKHIVSQEVVDGTRVYFEFATGEHGDRTQVVHLIVADLERGAPRSAIAYSIVGSVFELEHALVALRAADRCPFVNVSVNEDDVLAVRMAIVDIEKAQPQEVVEHLLLVARLADSLEEKIFGWDRM